MNTATLKLNISGQVIEQLADQAAALIRETGFNANVRQAVPCWIESNLNPLLISTGLDVKEWNEWIIPDF
jgi:hypothetical protein